ncbi:MAG: hypothetical protein M1813_007329 [Trichoglossum hirsutum]|nr:MAG: hypothetical protein M1813_007329 [Trichoglossum hirsutum]
MRGGSGTFAVLEREVAIKDSKSLLGSVVTDVRRPLDNYEPDLGPGPHLEEPLSFVQDYLVTVKEERPAVIRASATRGSSVRATLSQLFRVELGNGSNQMYSLRSDIVKTYEVQQHERLLEQLMNLYGERIKTLSQRPSARSGIFMAVAFKTAVNPTILRDAQITASEGVSVVAPLALPAVAMPAATVADGGLTFTQSWSSARASITQGEIVFAVQYCELVGTVTGFTLGTSEVRDGAARLTFQREFRSKGLRTYGKNVLALGSDDDDESSEEGQQHENDELV